mgnify:CR=1 FL=1
MLSSASILIGIIAGYIVAMGLGMVNYGKISSAAWFAFPTPLQYGIDFVPGAIILMLDRIQDMKLCCIFLYYLY